jgi:hypothetical protein
MPTEIKVSGDMRPEVRTRDAEIAELADRQHGVVAHRQLLEIGLTVPGIQHRLRAGRLHRRHRGVYSVGHRVLSWQGRSLAAVLACGPDALLSHRCAAALLGLLPYFGRRIDVSVPRRRRHRPGIVVHCCGCDGTLVDAIPVTSVARTLLDIASVVRFDQLRRAIEEAERRDLFDLHALERVMTPGRRGVRTLKTALRDCYDPGFTRSGVERHFARLCRDTGLPLPAMNLWIGDQEVDAVWEDAKVAVQLDSWEFHRTRGAFEGDRKRDAVLQRAGYRVLRITDRRLETEPAEVVSVVRALLQRTAEEQPS